MTRPAAKSARAHRRASTTRSVVGVRSVMVSQLTSEIVLGCNARRFLEEIVPAVEARGFPVARVGKLRIASVEDVESALLVERNPEDAPEHPASERTPENVADVLAQLGRRVAGRRP